MDDFQLKRYALDTAIRLSGSTTLVVNGAESAPTIESLLADADKILKWLNADTKKD